MDGIATINESAAIEITAIVKAFCHINIKLIIMKLLIKKALNKISRNLNLIQLIPLIGTTNVFMTCWK